MSQDSQVCIKCGVKCGYDDDKAFYDPGYLCGRCKGNLISRFCAFFGLTGTPSGDMGLEVSWREADQILSHIKRDYPMRVRYIVAEEELYDRTIICPTPIEKEIE